MNRDWKSKWKNCRRKK